jgi:hypothetical protein
MSSTGTTIDQMLSAVQAAGECLNVPAAPFASRWRVRLADGQELHFSEPTGNRLLLRKLIDRHPAEKPGSLAPTIRYVPVAMPMLGNADADARAWRKKLGGKVPRPKGKPLPAKEEVVLALNPKGKHVAAKYAAKLALRTEIEAAREARKEEIKATASQIFRRGMKRRPPFKTMPNPPEQQQQTHRWYPEPKMELRDAVDVAKAEREAERRLDRQFEQDIDRKVGRPRGPGTGAPKWELLSVLDELRSIALVVSSAWEVVPWAVRKPLLDQALRAEEVLGRGQHEDRRGRYRGNRRPQSYAVVRHPDMDLNALGAPDPLPAAGRAIAE